MYPFKRLRQFVTLPVEVEQIKHVDTDYGVEMKACAVKVCLYDKMLKKWLETRVILFTIIIPSGLWYSSISSITDCTTSSGGAMIVNDNETVSRSSG